MTARILDREVIGVGSTVGVAHLAATPGAARKETGRNLSQVRVAGACAPARRLARAEASRYIRWHLATTRDAD
jgi:hypothetical protein